MKNYKYGDSNFWGKKGRARRTKRRARRDEKKEIRMDKRRNGNTFFDKIGSAAGNLVQNLTGKPEPMENLASVAPIAQVLPTRTAQPPVQQKDDTQMYLIIGAVALIVVFLAFKDKF